MKFVFAIADGLNYSPPQAPAPPEFGPLLLRLFAMTLFVLVTCAGVIWATRYLRRPRIPTGSEGKLRTVESVVLTGRCTVHLIQAGSARVLVAIDPNGLKACHLVDDNFAGVLDGSGGAEPQRGSGPSVAEMMSLLAASKAA